MDVIAVAERRASWEFLFDFKIGEPVQLDEESLDPITYNEEIWNDLDLSRIYHSGTLTVLLLQTSGSPEPKPSEVIWAFATVNNRECTVEIGHQTFSGVSSKCHVRVDLFDCYGRRHLGQHSRKLELLSACERHNFARVTAMGIDPAMAWGDDASSQQCFSDAVQSTVARLLMGVAKIQSSPDDLTPGVLLTAADGSGPSWAYPIHVFPPVLRTFIQDGSKSIGTPLGWFGTFALCGLAAVIGRRFRLEVKNGQEYYAVLYAAVLARKGSGKTPTLMLALKPVITLQAEATQWYRGALSIWENLPPEERGSKPVEEHFWTSDMTPEAATKIVDEGASPGWVYIKDEILGWIRGMNAYGSSKGERQWWLSNWSGVGQKSDRAGRESRSSELTTISVVGGIQPSRLVDLQDEARADDALIERFIWDTSLSEPLRYTDYSVSPQALGDVVDLYRSLREGPEGVVKFSKDAREHWRKMNDEIANRQAATPEGLELGFLSKYSSIAARFALLLHSAAHGPNAASLELSEDTLLGAIELANYHFAHGLAVAAKLGDAAESPKAARVVAIVQASRIWLNRSVIYRKMSGDVTADELTTILTKLVAEGTFLHRVNPTGGRGGEQYSMKLDY